MAASTYSEASADVAGTFVAAFEGYVRGRVAALVGHHHLLEEALAEGRRRLESDFSIWRDLPADQQRRSPLEIFRDALRFPTEALTEAGVPAVSRDDGTARAMPGDVFDLSPMSSQELGEAAWKAHVAWGIARAEEIAGVVPARPHAAPDRHALAALVGSDLMDRSKLTAAAERAGYELAVWRNPGAIAKGLEGPPPAIAFVDLTHPVAHDAIRQLVGAGVHTVAFGPHVDDVAMAAAGVLGAQEVLPRSRFFARLPSLFPKAV